jgi:hypothetical protein
MFSQAGEIRKDRQKVSGILELHRRPAGGIGHGECSWASFRLRLDMYARKE